MSELSSQVAHLEMNLKVAQSELVRKKEEIAYLQREVANLSSVTRQQALDPISQANTELKRLVGQQAASIRGLELQASLDRSNIESLRLAIKLMRGTFSETDGITIVKNGVSKRFMPVLE